MTTDERTPCVAGYIRVSTTDQAKRWSLPMQREGITGYCRARGLPDPVRVYEDDESGKKVERDDFDVLLDDVRAGKYTHVVFLRLNRLARNLRGILEIHDDVFLENDTRLICVEQGFDSSTPMGRFVFQLMAATAELDGAQITERTRDGKHRQRREKGTWWGGTEPFGYQRGDKVGLLVPHPVESHVVGTIFRMRDAGNSMAEIIRLLDELKMRPRGGGIWRRQALQNILRRREFYAGRATINANAEDDGPAAAPAHPGII